MRGHIQKRGQRSYRLKWEVGRDPISGARITKQKTVNGTKRDAEAELGRILGALQSGTYVDPTKMTVGELVQKWRDEVAAVHVSAKTLERYDEHVERIRTGLGRLPLTRLQSLAVQSFYNDLRRSGHKRRVGGLSEQTILHIHKVLSAALQQAVRWRLISYNPADDIKAPRPARVEMLTLDGVEMQRLLREAEETRLFALAMVGLTTGLRRGELLGLSWRDIDFERGRLTVNRSLEETRGSLVLKPPKTRQSVRSLTLPQVTLEALRRHELQQKEDRLAAGPDYSDNGIVFADPTGLLQRPRNITKAFGDLVKRSGVRRISMHGLRHTHITELLRAGVHPKVVSERAGHSSVAFTLQRYAHALPDMQQDAADQTQKLVGNLLSK